MRSGRVDTLDDLLGTCVHDLRAGALAFAERAPGVTAHASDQGLRVALGAIVETMDGHAAAFGATSLDAGGSENLWMAGILDDAHRDTRTIERGPALDIAMIGAMRKALAASIVSYQTAIAMGGDFQALHDELVGADADLRDRLGALAHSGRKSGTDR